MGPTYTVFDYSGTSSLAGPAAITAAASSVTTATNATNVTVADANATLAAGEFAAVVADRRPGGFKFVLFNGSRSALQTAGSA